MFYFCIVIKVLECVILEITCFLLTNICFRWKYIYIHISSACFLIKATKWKEADYGSEVTLGWFYDKKVILNQMHNMTWDLIRLMISHCNVWNKKWSDYYQENPRKWAKVTFAYENNNHWPLLQYICLAERFI